MKLVDLEQRSDAWFAWRDHHVTASEVPTVMGVSPYNTPWQLWAEKVGIANPVDLSSNPNVQRGVDFEDEARELCESVVGESLVAACGECSHYPMLSASFDALSAGDIPYEMKCPTQKVFAELQRQGKASRTYEMYALQVKAQCVVADAEVGFLFFYEVESKEFLLFDVECTPEDRHAILTAVEDFWRCVESRTPPEKKPGIDPFVPASGTEEFRWRGLASAWHQRVAEISELNTRLDELKAQKDDLQAALIEEMGDFQRADYGGIKITRSQRRGTIDYKKACEDRDIPESELEAYRRPSTETVLVKTSLDTRLNEDAIGNELRPTGTLPF